MKILSVETSCDETSLALVEAAGGLAKPNFKILKNLVASQIKIHRPFGGVVPNLAKREHLRNLPILLNRLAKTNYSKIKIKKQKIFRTVDLIAATVGPGLEPCLWAGVNFTEELARKWNKPLVGVNHLKGHLYSFLLPQKRVNSGLFQTPNLKNLFPAVALIASGGHTVLLLLENLIRFRKLGETRDDAAGEAFDKAARMLGLPYPGGPEMEKLADCGDSTAVIFPRPMLNQKNYDFSFSGLKTALLYFLKNSRKNAKMRENGKKRQSENKQKSSRDFAPFRAFTDKSDIAASFQQAIIDVLTAKTFRAAQEFKAKTILLSGGVAANKSLRRTFARKTKENQLNFFAPPPKFAADNAAMIAAAAYFQILRKKNGQSPKLQADGNLSL